MNITRIATGDVVEVDHKGRRFMAVVTGRREHELLVEPIQRNVSYRTARAREVIAHWRRTGRARADHAPDLSPAGLFA